MQETYHDIASTEVEKADKYRTDCEVDVPLRVYPMFMTQSRVDAFRIHQMRNAISVVGKPAVMYTLVVTPSLSKHNVH
ncbi:hypothetical protein CEXT_565371 [Caerostris extrusa]|uniref:Uncharacterized protein n=1 Tax=Caerostris extrusa TaxID=172846 RepID=A0AAV4UKM0_CAEEX|nr:hypothetical protein CEXT_565371 [Caerostris extrusa]